MKTTSANELRGVLKQRHLPTVAQSRRKVDALTAWEKAPGPYASDRELPDGVDRGAGHTAFPPSTASTTMRPLIRHALLCSLFASFSVLAASSDADRFLLTPALLMKFENIQKDIAKGDEDQSLGGDAKTPEDLAKQVNANPKLKAALQKGGVDAREFSLATFAMLHASVYLMTEQMNKPKAEATFKTYTPEQQANIKLIRSRQGR